MCPKIENIEFVYNYFERIILNGNIILNYHNLNDLSIFPTDEKIFAFFSFLKVLNDYFIVNQLKTTFRLTYFYYQYFNSIIKF